MDAWDWLQFDNFTHKPNSNLPDGVAPNTLLEIHKQRFSINVSSADVDNNPLVNVQRTVTRKTQCGLVAFFAGFAGPLQRAESTTPAQSTQECFLRWTGTLAGSLRSERDVNIVAQKSRDTPPLWLIERVNFSLGRVRQWAERFLLQLMYSHTCFYFETHSSVVDYSK